MLQIRKCEGRGLGLQRQTLYYIMYSIKLCLFTQQVQIKAIFSIEFAASGRFVWNGIIGA